MWLIHLAFGAAFLFGCSFAQQDPENQNLTSAFDIIEELRTLKNIEEENRKRIAKHDIELADIKSELDAAKRNCDCQSIDNVNVAIPALERTRDPQLNENRIQKDRIIPPSSQDETIAFYAYMSTNMNNIGGQQTLIFDVVKTNAGNGLHPTTGVFTAPSSGFYVFTWTIRIHDNSFHSVVLILNGQEVGTLYQYVGPGEDDMSSTTVVIHVNEGEDVFLRTKSDFNQGMIHNSPHGRSSFSGWKLH